jgi:hypothetical protein
MLQQNKLECLSLSRFTRWSVIREQGDQKIGKKIAQILEKVAQRVTKPKNGTLPPSEFHKYRQQIIFSPKIFLAL